MRKILAVMAVSTFLVLCVAPMVWDDSDAAETKTYRYSSYMLWHCTARAEENVFIDDSDGIILYHTGMDESMKRYIADPTNVIPDKGVLRTVAGTYYEVYYLDNNPDVGKYVPGFLWCSMEKVLDVQPGGDLEKTKDAYLSFTPKSVKNFAGWTSNYCYAVFEYSDSPSLEQYLIVDEKSKISLDTDAERIRLSTGYYGDKSLYVEIIAEQELHVLEGSPLVYGSICAGITIALMAMIFLCGRNPDIG